MNKVQVFQNEQFGKIRSVQNNNEIFFVATDVCKSLEIKNVSQAVAKLDNDERSIFNIGRQGATNVVNEAGLYNLVLASRKPEAKAFKRCITHDVILDVRHIKFKTGNLAELKYGIKQS